MTRCAFVGLGVMGYPMAGHLQAAGHEVTVYNRTTARAEQWVAEHGGSLAATPSAAAAGADAVMVCVGNDDDVRSVVLGDDGALAGMAAGSTLVDHTTASAQLARELADAGTAQGVGFVDAPVSGGQAGAENGQLTKMVNQVCIGGLIQGLSEALDFGRRAGLDRERMLEAISQGASGSWQMDNRSRTMLDRKFDHGFAIDWMRKDFGIVFDEAERLGATLPVTAMVDQFYARLQRQGHGRSDTSTLIELLRDD